MEKLLLISFTLIALSTQAIAQSTKTFDMLWEQVYSKSAVKKSAELEKDGTELSLARAERHWLPRVYGSAQLFSTNDPTQVFFTNLGQRAIEQADFVPSDLNNPGRKNFKTGALGVDLPIYEGGMKSSQASMFKSLLKSSELEVKAKKSEEYTEFSRNYGDLIVIIKNERLLIDLKNNLDKVISSYQVGSQNNPVGYSGLLGLKGVRNRIEGSLYDLNLKATNSRAWINNKIETTGDWQPDLSEDLKDFLATKLSGSSSNSYSSMLLAQEFKVNSLENIKDMEKARHLPLVGLFAQTNIYSGDRDTSNAQAYGIYLAWDLFNSDSYGRVGEANAKLRASEAKIEAGKKEEKIMRDQLLASKNTLEKSLVLIEDSDKILQEQTSNATRLFRSGMLNALQLAEVINRRVDLIENKHKTESQYLDVFTRIYQLNN
jgi:outer membrane protein TolC